MADPIILTAALAAGFLVALSGTGLLCNILSERGILDRPNQRSSHESATPRGGGIAVLAAIAIGWCVLQFGGATLPDGAPVVGGMALVLATVSWVDDLRGLSALNRLLAHAVIVGLSLYLLPIAPPALLDALPASVQYLLMALAWIWFINLYNFMDGIDGITGVETLVVTIGIVLVTLAAGSGSLAAPALVIATATAGFLKWNWPPAKIFLGDVGSVPLGYLLGWLLLTMAGDGHLLPALLIPGYYLADATVTLVRRALRKERIWQAHREHAYQQAVQSGMPHGDVSSRVGVLGICLIGLALAAPYQPVVAALAGIAFIGAMLHHFTHSKTNQQD